MKTKRLVFRYRFSLSCFWLTPAIVFAFWPDSLRYIFSIEIDFLFFGTGIALLHKSNF